VPEGFPVDGLEHGFGLIEFLMQMFDEFRLGVFQCDFLVVAVIDDFVLFLLVCLTHNA
jgi:hypothetical protein